MCCCFLYFNLNPSATLFVYRYSFDISIYLFIYFLLFQEFHLSQTYHEGLLKLQAKEYDKARELLESVLKDPLIANAQVLVFALHVLLLRCLMSFWFGGMMCFFLLSGG